MSNIPSIESNVFLLHEIHSELEENKSPIEEKTETVSQPIFQAPSQFKGPNVLLRGQSLAEQTGATGGEPDPSGGGSSGSSGFDGLRSPPDIRDKGSKDSSTKPQQPAPQQQPANSEPGKPAAVSSQPTTQEVVDKGKNLLDKMKDLKEQNEKAKPQNASIQIKVEADQKTTPNSNSQIEEKEGFLKTIWDNFQSDHDDIVLGESNTPKETQDKDTPKITTVSDTTTVSDEIKTIENKGFFQKVWDNFQSDRDDAVFEKPKPDNDPSKILPASNEPQANENKSYFQKILDNLRNDGNDVVFEKPKPDNDPPKIVTVSNDSTLEEEKSFFQRIWSNFISNGDTVVVAPDPKKQAVEQKKLLEFLNSEPLGIAIPNLSVDKKSCVFPLFTGGLNNDLQEQKKYMDILEQSSKLSFGLAPTYNASLEDTSPFKWVAANLGSLFGAKMGFTTTGNTNIYDACIDAAHQAHKMGIQNYTIVMVVYSKGGTEAYTAIEKMHNSSDAFVKSIPNHIDFIGIGSAECIPEEKVKVVRHLVVDGDLVGISSHLYTQALQEGTVSILHPDESSQHHSFENPSYQKAVKKILEDYKSAD